MALGSVSPVYRLKMIPQRRLDCVPAAKTLKRRENCVLTSQSKLTFLSDAESGMTRVRCGYMSPEDGIKQIRNNNNAFEKSQNTFNACSHFELSQQLNLPHKGGVFRGDQTT